jgi:hypothetical protein
MRRRVFCAAGFRHQGYGMGPRVKPEDDERGEVGGKSPALEVGGNAHPFVILGS